ncbi:unnamed protein product [Choristocarpus tenellus]
MRFKYRRAVQVVCATLACTGCSALVPATRCSLLKQTLRRSPCRQRRSVVMKAGSDVLPKDKLLKQALYEGMEKETAAKLLDGAEGALRTWSTHVSDFMTPPDVAIMQKLIKPLADVEISSWGGHEQLSRQYMQEARGRRWKARGSTS